MDWHLRMIAEEADEEAREPAPRRATLEELQAELANAEAKLREATGTRIDMWREEVRSLGSILAWRAA